MSFYLLEAKRGLVLGCFVRRGEGWGFTPFTSAHRASRKAHDTREAACKRFATPSSSIVDCLDVKDAIRKSKELKVIHDQQTANHAIAQAITNPMGTT